MKVINWFFKTLSVLLLLLACFIFSTSVVSFNDLLYPQRIDSTFVKQSRVGAMASLGPDSNSVKNDFYYLPSMLGLAYEPMQVITSDKIVLKGWFIPAIQKNQAQTILILHDVGKSKIMYLPMAKALQDRGFNVCLFDLRAHGESGGLLFSLGLREDMDVKCIIDSVYKRINNKTIALMGVGLGADIALRLQHDPHVQCLILQSVGDRLSDYLKRNAKKRWGAFAPLFYPVMKRNTERLLHVDIDTLSNAKLAAQMTKPIFFIGGLDDRIVPIIETRIVYDTCNVEEKQYWPIRDAGHDEVEQKGGDEYYNEISVFIVRSIPKKLGKSRFRRLAVLNFPN